jgi:hypothetical protein
MPNCEGFKYPLDFQDCNQNELRQAGYFGVHEDGESGDGQSPDKIVTPDSISMPAKPRYEQVFTGTPGGTWKLPPLARVQ